LKYKFLFQTIKYITDQNLLVNIINQEQQKNNI